jgi:hypothetical protein
MREAAGTGKVPADSPSGTGSLPVRAGRVRRRRVGGRCRSMHRRRFMRGAFEYRRAVRCRGRRVLDRSGRVLNRGGRVLDRGGRVLNRSGGVLNRGGRVLDRSGRVSRLLDDLRTGTTVADRAAGAGALDHGPGARRRRRMATDRPPGTAAALDDRALSPRSGRGVLGRGTARVDRAATPERRSFLAENLAMGPAASTTGHGAAAGSTGLDAATDSARRSTAAAERRAFLAEDAAVRAAADSAGRRTAADSGRRGAAPASLAAQTAPTRNGRSGRLGRRVAAQRRAVAAQNGAAAFAADAQPSAACGAGAGLTADADTSEGARNVRSRSTIERSAFTGDQPRLPACAESRVATGTGEATGTTAAGHPAARGKTALASEATAGAEAATNLAGGTTAEPTTGTEAALASETRLAA